MRTDLFCGRIAVVAGTLAAASVGAALPPPPASPLFPAPHYDSGDRPTSIVFGNIDADTDMDLAILASERMSVLPNQRIDSGLPLCLGDFNGDGQILISDFNILATNFAQSVPPGTSGDVTGDGVVDVSDFNVFVQLFGGDCP